MAGGELMRRDPHHGLEAKSGLRTPEQELDIDRGLDLVRIAPSADPVDDVTSMREARRREEVIEFADSSVNMPVTCGRSTPGGM